MQIYRITPVMFGHSKKNQNWLETRANKLEDKKLAENLKTCSRMCNSMEDEIIELEAKNGSVSAKSDLMDFYTSLKNTVLIAVLANFDDGDKYLKAEYDYYSKGLKNKKDPEINWRSTLITLFKSWEPNLGKTKEDLARELAEANRVKDENKLKVADVLKTYGEQKETAATSTDENPIIETIKTTEFSPKGFDDVKGLEELKEELYDEIVLPANDPELAKLYLEEYGQRMPTGVLLFGPPGCGKTYIIEALSKEIDSKVYIMNTANTGSRYVNQTSNNIRNAFETVFKEGEKSEKPVFIFLDEMDAMTSRENGPSSCAEDTKQVATLLQYIEAAKAHNVIVIGATNKYDWVDPAIRRRFSIKKYVGLPNEEQRVQLLENNLKNKKKGQNLLNDKEALEEISKSLEGYSYHSINIIADNASKNALKRGMADISKEDFKLAIKKTDEEKINEREYMPKSRKMSIGFSAEI